MKFFGGIQQRAAMLTTGQKLLLKAGYLAIMTAVIYFYSAHWAYDDPFITYRYAENIREGVGFVYNAGERVLSTTTPLFALLLSVLSRVWGDLPHLAVLIGAFSLAAGALALFELASSYRTRGVGWALLLLYPLFPLVMQTLGSETPLYLALILTAFAAYERRSYPITAVCSALAVLARPDGILAPAVLGLHFLLLRREAVPWKSVLIFAAITLAWFGFAQFYFGSPLPVTLSAKQHQGQMSMSQTFLPGMLRVAGWYAGDVRYKAMLALAVVGLAGSFLRCCRAWWLVLAWTLAYFAGYSLLGVTQYFWYYAPLVPGFMVLAALGARMIGKAGARLRSTPSFLWGLLAAGIIGVVWTVEVTALINFPNFSDPRIPVYRQVGGWLRENTPPGASAGALEVGAVGYDSRRTMVDFAGLLQPDVAGQLSAGTTYEDAAVYAINQYQPDFVILNAGLFPDLETGVVGQRCRKVETFSNENMQVLLYDCR